MTARYELLPNRREMTVKVSGADSGWQPIETAPRDGSMVLTGSWSFGQWMWGKSKYAYYRWWNVGAASGDRSSPTHWMPLPAPPEQKQEQPQ